MTGFVIGEKWVKVCGAGKLFSGEGAEMGRRKCVILAAAAIAWEQVLVVFILFVLVGGPGLWIWWPGKEREKAIATP